MESLWSEVFKDSSDYIRLVFDNYFSPSTIAHSCKEGEVEASILGVPYDFVSEGREPLRGLYLCGIATKETSRRRGIMSRLIEQINDKAKRDGFDFTFLIPASDRAKEYYEVRGYHNAFYKIEEHFVRGHKFKGGTDLELKRIDKENLDEALTFLKQYHLEGNARKEYELLHTLNDWKIVLEESLISEDPVYMALSRDRFLGIAFTEDKGDEVKVKRIMAAGAEEGKGILKKISELYPERNLSVVADMDEIPEETQLWSPFFAKTNGPAAEYEDMSELEQPFDKAGISFPFGMVRIFDIFDVLRKSGFEGLEKLKDYSHEELTRLVLRRSGGESNDGIGHMLDLPYLGLKMSLLLE